MEDGKQKTLYDRLGGDNFAFLFTQSFFDEILENEELKPIFKHASISALKSHQVKLFRVIFGPKDERPDPDAFLDFMFQTHARLFRDSGLNEHHFDLVAAALVRGLKTFSVEQEELDEVLSILGPARAVFEQGAKVAQAEQDIVDPTLLDNLPIACAANIGEDPATMTLPTYAKVDIPNWLAPALAGKKKKYSQSIVRAWTCDLTDRFGEDTRIADTFMDQPYMEHHVYLVYFLQLAFMPHNRLSREEIEHVRNKVKYPRGQAAAPLSQKLFDRMVRKFKDCCRERDFPVPKIAAAVDRLYTHRTVFAEKTRKVGGITRAHILRKTPPEAAPRADTCMVDCSLDATTSEAQDGTECSTCTPLSDIYKVEEIRAGTKNAVGLFRHRRLLQELLKPKKSKPSRRKSRAASIIPA